MVVPLVLAGLVGAVARFAPVITRFGLKAVRAIIPKTGRGKLFAVTTAPTIVGLGTTPTGKKVIGQVIDPRKGFERGIKLGQPKLPSAESPLLKGAKKAGVIGAVVGVGALAGKTALEKIKEKKPGVAKTITAQTMPQIVPIPPEMLPEITKPIGAVEKPKKKELPAPALPSINNNIDIDIRFSKKNQFINQQLLIK